MRDCITPSKANLLRQGCGEGKYSVQCRVPSKGVGDKPQIHFSLVFELRGFRLREKNKEAGNNHCHVTFPNCRFASQDVSDLGFSGQVVHGSGVC